MVRSSFLVVFLYAIGLLATTINNEISRAIFRNIPIDRVSNKNVECRNFTSYFTSAFTTWCSHSNFKNFRNKMFFRLEHPFHSEHVQKSVCNGGFSLAVGCRLYSCKICSLKISLYVCVHIKTIPWKFLSLKPNNSRFISPWSLGLS